MDLIQAQHLLMLYVKKPFETSDAKCSQFGDTFMKNGGLLFWWWLGKEN